MWQMIASAAGANPRPSSENDMGQAPAAHRVPSVPARAKWVARLAEHYVLELVSLDAARCRDLGIVRMRVIRVHQQLTRSTSQVIVTGPCTERTESPQFPHVPIESS